MWRSYRIGDATFGIRTTSEAFAEWLDETLTAYARRRRSEPEFSVVLDGDTNGRNGRGRRFHVLYRGVGAVVRTFELATLGTALLAELEARLLPERTDAVYVHAALVDVDGVRLLAPSWFVSYLSHLGRRVERAGVHLPLAAWIAVDRDSGRVIRPRPILDVPADAVERLGRIDGSTAPTPGPDTSADVDAVLTYVPSLDTIRPVSRAVALYRLGSLAPNLERMGADGVSTLRSLVSAAPFAYETGLGRPRQMLDALIAVAEHHRSHR